MKKPKLRVVIILILYAILSSCSINKTENFVPSPTTDLFSKPNPIVSQTVTPENTIIQTPELTVTDEVAAEVNRTKYKIDLDFDYGNKSSQGVETIIYQNSTGDEIDVIDLVFTPARYNNGSKIELIPSAEIMEIINDEKNNEQFHVKLCNPLRAGGAVEIKLQILINLPAENGVFGYTDKQANFFNWYPVIPAYDTNNGWIIREYSKIGEYLVNEKADFDVSIHVRSPQKVIVVGTGDVVIQDEIFYFTHLNARDFSFSVSPYYQETTTEMGSTKISAFMFPEDAEAGKELVRNTAAALIYYETLLDHKYPHSNLKIIEADFPDGMESDGLYFLSTDYIHVYDGTQMNYMTILSAHETAHQWFYGIVGSDQAMNPWLDEALCTLSEAMYFEEFYPMLVDWWWEYRVNSYQPKGNVNITVYDASSIRTYINSVYLQGARFLQEIRSAKGDEIFIEALRRYVASNKDQIATEEDFFTQFKSYPLDSIKSNYFGQ